VGQPIVATIERGGQRIDVELAVQDLNEITPSRYVDVGGAILHELSYQLARGFNIPVAGVYVARVGYMLGNESIARGNVITSLAGKPVTTLDEAEAILKTVADGEQFALRFFSLGNPRHEQQRIVTMDRRWSPAETCQRDDHKGLWMCEVWPAPPQNHAQQPSTTTFVSSDDRRIKRLAPSMVVVDFDMPYPVSGIRNAHYVGSGLIVNARRGWVLVDRNTVPSRLGDVRITFAGSLEVPGKVAFIHPFHNLAIVSYDPALIGDTAVKNVRFSRRKLLPGDDVWLVGSKPNQQFISHKTTVASVDAVQLPLPNIPAFRETNMEVVKLTSQVNTVGGVLSNSRGEVQGLWTSFEYQRGKKIDQILAGIPAELVRDMLETLGDSLATPLNSLSTEFRLISLAEARKRGLPDDWALTLERHHSKRRDVLYVLRMVAGSPAAALLNEGDLVLAIDGKMVNTFREVEKAAQAAVVNLTVVRRGEVLEIALPTEPLSGEGLSRVIGWAGALLQMPYREMAAQRGLNDPGLYVSWTWPGSPANHYGLRSNLRLVELEGYPVIDFDSFLDALAKTAGRESVRMKVLTLNGRQLALTLKPDRHYWPTYELVHSANGWHRHVFEEL